MFPFLLLGSSTVVSNGASCSGRSPWLLTWSSDDLPDFQVLVLLISSPAHNPQPSDPEHLSSSDWYHLPSSIYSWPVGCPRFHGLPGPTSCPRLTCHTGPHRFRPHSGSQPLFHLKGWLVESSMNWGHFPLQPASMSNPPEPQTIVLYHPGSNSVSVQGKEEQQVKYLGKEHWHSLCKIIPSKGGKGCQMRADTLGRDSPSLITVLFYLIKLCMTAKG